MNYRNLVELDRLMHSVWDAAVLHCLSREPMHYNELNYAVTTWSGQPYGESTQSGTLKRLERAALITGDNARKGRRLYAITATGRQRLDLITALTDVLAAGRHDGRPRQRHRTTAEPTTGHGPHRTAPDGAA